MGVFGGIAGAFSAVQQARSAKEAQAILVATRQMLEDKAGEMSRAFSPFLDKSLAAFDESAGFAREDRSLLQRLIADTEKADLGQGFSEADTIALKDAQKLLNENLVGTGNLRSGVAGFYNMELARRFVADVRSRQIDRRLNQLQLLFGGANQLQGTTGQTASRGSVLGQIGAQGKTLAAQLFSQSGNLAIGQAQATLAKGQALAGAIDSAASTFDVIDPIAWAEKLGGAAKGKSGALAFGTMFGMPGAAPTEATQEAPGYGGG